MARHRTYGAKDDAPVVLGDAGFGSFAEIALLALRGIDVVFLQGARESFCKEPGGWDGSSGW